VGANSVIIHHLTYTPTHHNNLTLRGGAPTGASELALGAPIRSTQTSSTLRAEQPGCHPDLVGPRGPAQQTPFIDAVGEASRSHT